MPDGELFADIDAFLGGCRADTMCREYWHDHQSLSRADIRLLAEIGRERFCPAAFAERSGRRSDEARVFLEALAGIGIVTRCAEGYRISDAALIYCRTFANS